MKKPKDNYERSKIRTLKTIEIIYQNYKVDLSWNYEKKGSRDENFKLIVEC